MNLKRLFRLAAIGGTIAAGVAAFRALNRDNDPLPSPASGPTEPWPPLRAATAPAPQSSEPVEAPDKVEEPTEDSSDDDRSADLVDADGDESEALLDVAAPASDGDAKPKRRRSRPLRAAWMPPNEDGSCPDGYPLKANDASMIFHAPGQMSYDRTVPERCYADAEAAVADGYRAAKR